AHPPDVINIARALGQIGPDAREAVPALSRVAAQADPASYSAAVYALLRIDPARVDADEAVPDLIQDLGRIKSGTFDAASEALALVGAGAVPSLIEALEQGSGLMRRQACVSLGRMGAEARDAVPALLEEVKTNRSGVRLYAMRALGKIGERSEEVVPLLIGSLKDPKLRCWAMLSLADLGAKAQAAVPFIEPFLKDKDVTVRDRAETALRKIRAALRSVPPPEEQIEDVF
ncbi:MAG: HEAT repeat domain-containing protein, partial [Planctomycetota bacterium]